MEDDVLERHFSETSPIENIIPQYRASHFSIKELFTITKKYRQELDNKINSFRDSLKLRRTIHLVFITTYGLKHNEYSGVVQNEVTLKDLFD